MLSLKIERKKGEKTRRFLDRIKALDTKREIGTKKEHLYIPVKRELTPEEEKEIGRVEYSTKKLKKKEVKAKNLKQALAGKLTKDELATLKTSFDMIGEIAVLLIPPELQKKEKKIADAILEVHRNIKTVCKRKGAVEGEYRVRPLEIIAGEKKTITTTIENKHRYRLDLEKVFYTPRLASERERIVKKVRKNEIIVDMFAGVGPFTIPIAKKCRKIYAIDLNPDAYRYLLENIKANKVKNAIAILGDAQDIEELVPEKADRVIMNLPKHAFGFLKKARAITKEGGTIHYHCFGQEDKMEEIVGKIEQEIGEDIRITGKRKVRQTSPREYNWAIDIRVPKKDIKKNRDK